MLKCALVALIPLCCSAGAPAEAAWNAVGPAGGAARAFAAEPGNPNHLYLGTTTGWIYESRDGGSSWHHLARLGSSNDLIIDHIIVDSVDSHTMYAAGWWPDRDGGGLWISHDAGNIWSEVPDLRGQSIRALVQSPSAPRTFIAGTLQGVFRSDDAGATWRQISPVGDREIHEIESLAVDPQNPEIVYAGTWHLPWKTTDGGKKWHSIKRGLIVDSDVFSIILDPEHTKTVYLSACSGIYKSENAGLLFHKINGIPSSARRTRVLTQDPANRATVYAGTTEGLYKTMDAGRTFHRMTDADVIVNDVYVDPSNSKHVLLATDRGGVMVSENGGESFAESNEGISGRKVEALLVDRKNPEQMYAGVVNDKSYGGVFVSFDGGTSWTQIGHGLEGLDVFALAQANDGTILAGTEHGIFALPANDDTISAVPDPGGDPPATALSWKPVNTLANTDLKAATKKVKGVRVNVEEKVKDPVTNLDARVTALDASGDVWIATTSLGVFTSKDKGATWQGGPVMGSGDYGSVAVHDGILAASRPGGMVESTDGGQTWMPINFPQMLTRIHCIAFTPDGTLWVAAREGVFFTPDMGKSWKWLQRLPFRNVNDLSYDAAIHKILVSSNSSDQVFAIDPKKITWNWWQTGYNISLIRAAGDRLVAASMDDGVVVEPRPAGMESSKK
ncbi:MAG TPA: transcriptional regulator [Terracidiphilus sp.]|nr:transcriptional regulator [Terracidiphilus sp.]